jgi:hypothetical protein
MGRSSGDKPSSNPLRSLNKPGPARPTSPVKGTKNKVINYLKNKVPLRKASVSQHESQQEKVKWGYGDIRNMPEIPPNDLVTIMMTSPEHLAKCSPNVEHQSNVLDSDPAEGRLNDLDSGEVKPMKQEMSTSARDMKSRFDPMAYTAPNDSGSTQFDLTQSRAKGHSDTKSIEPDQIPGPQSIHQTGARTRMMSEPPESDSKPTVQENAGGLGVYGTSLSNENTLQILQETQSTIFEVSSQVDLSTFRTQSEIAKAAMNSNHPTSGAEWVIYLKEYSEVRAD